MPNSKSMLVVSLFVAIGSRAHAQELLREHDDQYGQMAASIADVDGDGIADYAVARFDPAGIVGEEVEVRSGRSGVLIRSIPSGQPPGTPWRFGYALADAGDVDADGVNDLLVGAMLAPDPAGSFPQCGAAFVYSGSDGHLLWSGYGGANITWFGESVAGLGDVDGDGHSDFVVGAGLDNQTVNGVACTYSGATGALLYTVVDAIVVTSLSDHDGDGIRDFATVDWDAQVVSGASGTILATIPTSNGFFGGVAEIDDLDGDGEPEIVLGEYTTPSPYDGQVRVISIPTLTTRRIHSAVVPDETLGYPISSGFDADGDGVHDYLVGAAAWFTSSDPGSASLFSGRTGERLYRFVDRDTNQLMGSSATALGDLDHDGFDECLVGSPFHHPPGTSMHGSDFVYRGNDLWLDAYPKSVAAGATESVAIHGAPNANPVALFVVDFAGTPAFQLAAFGLSNSVEAFTVSGIVPTGLTGSEWTLRAYALDANGKLIDSADEVIEFQ